MHVPHLAVALLLAPLCAQSPQANSHITARGAFNAHTGPYTSLTGFARAGTEYALITTGRKTTLIKVVDPDGPWPIHTKDYGGPDNWDKSGVIKTDVGEYAITLAGSPGDSGTGFMRFTGIVGDVLGSHADWTGGAHSVTNPHSIAISDDHKALGVCDPDGSTEILYRIDPGTLPQTSPHNPALVQTYAHKATHTTLRGSRHTSVVLVPNQPYLIVVRDGVTHRSTTPFVNAGTPHGVVTLVSGTHALVASVTRTALADTYMLTAVEALTGAMIPLPNTVESGPNGGNEHVTTLHVRDDIVYVAYGTLGFRAYDLSTFPAVPPAIMSFDNPSGDELVDIYPQPSGMIYALYKNAGFRVLHPSITPTSYGSGTAGTGALVPVLGHPTPAYVPGVFTYAVSNALPSTVGVFLLGTTPTAIPIFGITLLVDPSSWLITPGFFVSGAGTAALPLPIPNNITLLSLTLCNQGVIVDAGGPFGFSATQGLRLN